MTGQYACAVRGGMATTLSGEPSKVRSARWSTNAVRGAARELASRLRLRPGMNRLRTSSGFSIGELLAVVALCGIVAAALVPAAGTIINHHRLRAATRQLSFEVARARMQAVGQNQFVRLRLVDPATYVRERSSDGVAFVADGDPVSLPAHQEVEAGETGTPQFNRQGLATTSTTLRVSGPAGQRMLQVSVLGRVTVQ